MIKQLEQTRIVAMEYSGDSHPFDWNHLIEFLKENKNEVCHRLTLRLCFYLVLDHPFNGHQTHYAYKFLKFVLTELDVHPVDRVLVYFMMQHSLENYEDMVDLANIRMIDTRATIVDQFIFVLLGKYTLANTELVVMYLVFTWFHHFSVPYVEGDNMLKIAIEKSGTEAICALIRYHIRDLEEEDDTVLLQQILEERANVRLLAMSGRPKATVENPVIPSRGLGQGGFGKQLSKYL